MSGSRVQLLSVPILALLGCQFGEKPGIVELESGVDVRVDAIISLPNRGLGYFAAAGGVVFDNEGGSWQLSGHSLRSFATERNDRYWVVGDHGYIAYTDISDASPIEWTSTLSGTQANFYAARPSGDRVVVVGDDVVLIGIEEQPGVYVWAEPEAPSEGWGLLRAVSSIPAPGSDVRRFLAVGLQGRALLSEPGGESWEVAVLAEDTDFTSLCNGFAVGEGLSRASWSEEGWVVRQGESPADYIAMGGVSCGGLRSDYALSSDRWISRVSGGKISRVYQLPWQGRALDPSGIYVAGDDGHIAFWDPAEPGDL